MIKPCQMSEFERGIWQAAFAAARVQGELRGVCAGFADATVEAYRLERDEQAYNEIHGPPAPLDSAGAERLRGHL